MQPRGWIGPAVLLAGFVATAAEIAAAVWVAGQIGVLWTILPMVATAVIGVVLTKHEGLKAWRALIEASQSGKLPGGPLADGALIMLGGLLLVVPGFLNDIVGLLLLLPFTRPLVRKGLALLAGAFLVKRVGGPTVIEGEVVESAPDDEPPTVIKGEIDPRPTN